MAITVGEPVPNFTTRFDETTSTSLEDCRGKKVVLYFYPRDNSPGCTLESCGFRDFYERFQELNAEVIGVSKDSPSSHTKFKEKYNLPFLLLSDPDGHICEIFNVLKEKKIYGKKYLGIERSTFVIDQNGILRAEWRNVKVPGHVEEVLRTIKKLG